MDFTKFLRTPLLQKTSGRLQYFWYLTAMASFKKCFKCLDHRIPSIFGNFPDKRLQLSLFSILKLQLFLSTWNFNISECDHIRAYFFTSYRIVLRILYKNTLQRKSSSMKVRLYTKEKTVEVESAARGF